MDSLTYLSPTSLRRSTIPDEFYVGESMFDWDAQGASAGAMGGAMGGLGLGLAPGLGQPKMPQAQQVPQAQGQAVPQAHSHLSPPESFDMHTPLIKHGGLQKTPVRKRASSNASSIGSHFSPGEYGLVTPISMGGTPATFWAGQKLDFMTPTASRSSTTTLDDYMNTPLQTPVPLGPTSPLFKSPTQGAATTSTSGAVVPSAPGSVSASGSGCSTPTTGTNPFYCLPVCMRGGAEPLSSLASPDASEDFEFKAKAASAAEEALANFEEPKLTRSRANSRADSSRAPSEGAEEPVDKPFGCSHCSKSFRRMEHLRRHSKIHTKERPFSCSITNCGRKFSRSDNLKAHMKTHAKPTGRNIYVEGLALEEVPATPKRRKVD